MTDRLSIYNGALVVHLGEPPLAAVDDDVPVRYALDAIWDRDGVERCLKQGQWNFAARAVMIEPEPSVTPSFGYQYAFTKPDDFVRTLGVCHDQNFDQPLRRYFDDSAYWWADEPQLFVRYVSKDNAYGLDFSLWPVEFTSFVEAWFALQISNSATYSGKRPELEKTTERLLLEAKSLDAMAQPSKRQPLGSWVRSRYGSGSDERGSRSRLIG